MSEPRHEYVGTFERCVICTFPRQHHHREEHTTMTELSNQELNAIWHALTPAAKRSWVQAMQPDPDDDKVWDFARPDLTDEPPVTADDLDRIVAEYVARVQRSGTRNAVLDAIRLDGHTPRGATEETGSRYDIASELAECAHSMGIPAPDVDGQPDEHDAYMDMLYGMLPEVDRLLRGDV